MTTVSTEGAGPFALGEWFARGLAWATASHARAVGLLLVVGLLSFLPGFLQIPPIDRDEARFAQATRQMIETGDYIDIRFQNEVRYKKPVGIYWLQAAVVKTAATFGFPRAEATIWLYRIPSLIGAIGAVLLTYWAALALTGRRAALAAALLFAVSGLLGIEARLAKTDAMLLLTIVAAMGVLARLYLQLPDAHASHEQAEDRKTARWLLPLIFWSALAGGILLKGPLILLFVGLTIAALGIHDRSLAWLGRLRPLLGIPFLILIVLPWFLAIAVRAGDSFFVDSVGRDLLGKVATGQESHGGPPGLYALLFWATFLIAGPLVLMAIPAIRKTWREPRIRFLLAWLLPAWILLEIVVTKLPHYVLPLYPAIAILVADVAYRGQMSDRRGLVGSTVLWPIGAFILVIACLVATIMWGRHFALLTWPFAAAALWFSLQAWRSFEVTAPTPALGYGILASILLSLVVYAGIVPRLNLLFPSAALANAVRNVECGPPSVAAVGFHEPSLVFLVGTETRLTDAGGAANFLTQGGCRIALVEARHERSFAQRAEAVGAHFSLVGRVQGFNIGGGRAVNIAIFQAQR